MLPFKPIFLFGISSCYGNIIEHTESIGSTAHTVVSWRSVNNDREVIHVMILVIYSSFSPYREQSDTQQLTHA